MADYVRRSERVIPGAAAAVSRSISDTVAMAHTDEFKAEYRKTLADWKVAGIEPAHLPMLDDSDSSS